MSGGEPSRARITGLFVYPVKGCRGIPLDNAVMGERGIEGDRRWMIVTPEGRFLSQRELPAMATIATGLRGGTLVLRHGAESVELQQREHGEAMRVQVWRDAVDALRPSPAADRLVSGWLGREVRLVRFPEAARRPCDPDYAPAGSHTAFADGFPLLVTTQASLDALNATLTERAAASVPMARFRPSIVVSGVAAGEEDRHRWLHLAGGAAVELVKPCDRCVVVTTDQESGLRDGAEPLATLKTVRRNPRSGGAWFGQNGVPHLPGGVQAALSVGATVAFASTPPAPLR
ncbi:MOSC N-terminal beta barrel domain-containing protein [Geminicoccaceae bacterium 1502E]|nr:MOSC N-terminal beta barrel domain-containing protein [Geminicoccaceae bacterium 1502E]